jgi:tetratricopeptide (TPR) repeat protein
LPINMDLMIKGLSYFTVAKNISHDKKREYYLKTIRTLTGVISRSILEKSNAKINSLVYFHLAYSYLLFGEEYFDISLRYFNASEKYNQEDKLLSRKKDEEKLPLLELYEVTGSIYFQLGQYENAKEYFLKAKKLNMNEVMYNLILAHSYYETGSYEEAYINYKIVLENFNTTDNPIFTEEFKRELFLILAKINYVKKDYINAIDFYEDYIKDYGDSAEIRYIIGKIYETLSFQEKNNESRDKYMKKAIEQWKKSLEIKPNYGKSRLKLWRYNIDI